MVETQDKKPIVSENLERVGITDLRTVVRTNWMGDEYTFIPRITLTIGLEKEKKGAHMSRFIESITETIEEQSQIQYGSIEELEKHILLYLKKKHPYENAEITMETELVVVEKTPVSKKKTFETHDVIVSVKNTNGKFTKALTAIVLGNSACPHAMRNVKNRTHIQRAKGLLEIETDYDNPLKLEDMIKCIEDSFSSKVYTLVKTSDEDYLINQMFENPLFVEDVTRKLLHNAKGRFKNARIRVKTESYESIHRHNVVAESSCEN